MCKQRHNEWNSINETNSIVFYRIVWAQAEFKLVSWTNETNELERENKEEKWKEYRQLSARNYVNQTKAYNANTLITVFACVYVCDNWIKKKIPMFLIVEKLKVWKTLFNQM